MTSIARCYYSAIIPTKSPPFATYENDASINAVFRLEDMAANVDVSAYIRQKGQ